MTPREDDIIDLARQAAGGMLSFDADGEWHLNQREVERFAELVRNAALDEAIMRCKELILSNLIGGTPQEHDQGCWRYADAIRALKRTVA